MKIQTITVEIHEKRNHPHEYGHYDSKVSYTAQLDEGEDAGEAVRHLQFHARQNVAIECDRWIADIEWKRQIDAAKTQLDWIIDRAENNVAMRSDAENFAQNLAILPSKQRDEYCAKLETAKQTYLTALKRRLEEDLKDAARGDLSKYNAGIYYQLLDNLPEAERADYRTRMEAALAPKAEVLLAENEEDIAF